MPTIKFFKLVGKSGKFTIADYEIWRYSSVEGSGGKLFKENDIAKEKYFSLGEVQVLNLGAMFPGNPGFQGFKILQAIKIKQAINITFKV